MNLYADLTTLKSASVADFASVTAHDLFLMTLLEAASRGVDDFCNRHFYVENKTNYFDGAGKRLMLAKDLLSVTTLKTDSDGDGVFETTFAATDYFLYPLNAVVKTWLDVNGNGDYSDLANGVQKGVEIAGVWGYGDGKSVTPYKASGTTTAEELDASETGVDVADGTALAAGQTILIESEQMFIESISTNTLTVERGVNGTTAATHATGKAVYIYRYPKAITVATILQTLRWWKRRESAFQTAVQTEIGSVNVYRGLDPDFAALCHPYRLVNV
jgi:hypothetical protein